MNFQENIHPVWPETKFERKLSEKMLFKKAYVPEQKLPVLVYTAAFLAPLTKQIK